MGALPSLLAWTWTLKLFRERGIQSGDSANGRLCRKEWEWQLQIPGKICSWLCEASLDERKAQAAAAPCIAVRQTVRRGSPQTPAQSSQSAQPSGHANRGSSRTSRGTFATSISRDNEEKICLMSHGGQLMRSSCSILFWNKYSHKKQHVEKHGESQLCLRNGLVGYITFQGETSS